MLVLISDEVSFFCVSLRKAKFMIIDTKSFAFSIFVFLPMIAFASGKDVARKPASAKSDIATKYFIKSRIPQDADRYCAISYTQPRMGSLSDAIFFSQKSGICTSISEEYRKDDDSAKINGKKQKWSQCYSKFRGVLGERVGDAIEGVPTDANSYASVLGKYNGDDGFAEQAEAVWACGDLK
jgi:hypothetical protein